MIVYVCREGVDGVLHLEMNDEQASKKASNRVVRIVGSGEGSGQEEPACRRLRALLWAK